MTKFSGVYNKADGLITVLATEDITDVQQIVVPPLTNFAIAKINKYVYALQGFALAGLGVNADSFPTILGNYDPKSEQLVFYNSEIEGGSPSNEYSLFITFSQVSKHHYLLSVQVTKNDGPQICVNMTVEKADPAPPCPCPPVC